MFFNLLRLCYIATDVTFGVTPTPFTSFKPLVTATRTSPLISDSDVNVITSPPALIDNAPGTSAPPEVTIIVSPSLAELIANFIVPESAFVPVIVKALKDTGLKFKVALVISVYESIDMDIVKEVKDGIINAIGEENLIYMQDLSQSEISDYYSMLDLFVMSSMFESFGKAAVEAMSRRCSVASTAVGGLREVIGKEENLYGKDSLDKLADRVRFLINDKDELEKDREFFFNRFNNNFRRQIHYDKHKALYREILNKS